MPVIRTETIEAHPELADVLEELGVMLTEEIMQELNYKVDDLGERPEDVAREFLENSGLINNK